MHYANYSNIHIESSSYRKTRKSSKRNYRCFLEKHGLAGNTEMTSNVTAQLHVKPKNQTFSAREPIQCAWVQAKSPSFALADRDEQKTSLQK